MAEKKYSILIADDDDGDRKHLKRLLTRQSLSNHISEAKDAYEAVILSKSKTFDFAFIDQQMPGGEGLDMIPKLLNNQQDLNIILVTGQGNEEIASNAIKLGAVDYISKRLLSEDNIKLIVKNAVDKMKLKKKLRDQQESLERFSYILAHDLSTPMAQIMALSEIIEEELSVDHHDDVLDYISLIKNASNKALCLIRDLSEYNAIDGNDRVNFEPLSMKKIAMEAVINLKQYITEKNATVTVSDLPNIVGNESQLTLLMQNLIQNGIKYCDKQNPMIKIESVDSKSDKIIKVSDNGIGIAEENYEMIFEHMKRLHAYDDKKYGGSGLGLSTCKVIVERHNGEIWCESELGKGTTFFFTLGVEEQVKETEVG